MSCKGDCVTLYTRKGQPFAVSPEDVEWATQRKWCINSRGYMLAGILGHYVYLHHAVMAQFAPAPLTTVRGQGTRELSELASLAPTPRGWVRDHEDGDRLHNCRGNLRWVSCQENSLNCARPTTAATGYRGVYVSRKGNYARYVVHIHNRGKHLHIGYFTDPVEAARAYNRAALELQGQYARLNEIRESALPGGCG